MIHRKTTQPHGKMLVPGKIQKGKEPDARLSLRSPSAARVHQPGFPARREKVKRKVGVQMVGYPSKPSLASLGSSFQAAICEPGSWQPQRSRTRNQWKLLTWQGAGWRAERESLQPNTGLLRSLALSAPMLHNCVFLCSLGFRRVPDRDTE